MGLDYTDGCVNYRDVGEFINLIYNKKYLAKGIITRGGSIDFVKNLNEIGNAKSIINLRNRADFNSFDVDYYHFPMSNKIEKYDTSQVEVKKWLNKIIRLFENSDLKYPILIHCLSGKDRTGIVISALLLILKIDIKTIKEEYLLSDGDVKTAWIELAINGMMDIDTYFNQIDLKKVRENLMKIYLK